MGRRFFLFLFILATVSAFTLITYAQSVQKTLTLPGGEVVCDINGEWNAVYEHYGSLASIPRSKGLVIILLNGDTFIGKTANDSMFTPKGTEKIRGVIDKNGLKNVERTRPDSDWSNAKAVMNKDCNKIEIDDGDALKIILERK